MKRTYMYINLFINSIIHTAFYKTMCWEWTGSTVATNSCAVYKGHQRVCMYSNLNFILKENNSTTARYRSITLQYIHLVHDFAYLFETVLKLLCFFKVHHRLVVVFFLPAFNALVDSCH